MVNWCRKVGEIQKFEEGWNDQQPCNSPPNRNPAIIWWWYKNTWCSLKCCSFCSPWRKINKRKVRSSSGLPLKLFWWQKPTFWSCLHLQHKGIALNACWWKYCMFLGHKLKELQFVILGFFFVSDSGHVSSSVQLVMACQNILSTLCSLTSSKGGSQRRRVLWMAPH